MKQARQRLPVVGAILLVLVFWMFMRSPDALWQWSAAALVVTVMITLLSMNIATVSAGWWHALIPPLILTPTSLALLLFAETSGRRWLVVAVTAAVVSLYWEQLRRAAWEPERQHSDEAQTIALFVRLVTVWLLGSFLYRLLLDPTILPPAIAPWAFAGSTALVLAAVVLLDTGADWLRRYPPKANLYLVVVPLLVGEGFWVVNLLPVSPDAKAFLVGFVYYVLVSLERAHLDGTLRTALVRRYAYFALAAFLGVLLTARWLV